MHGLAHITGDGLLNLLRLNARVGYEIDAPLPPQPVFALIARSAASRRRDARGVQHGHGLLLRGRRGRRSSAALETPARRTTPGGARIGAVTERRRGRDDPVGGPAS